MKKNETPLVLSQKDYRKLSALVASCRQEAVAILEEEIGRADIVSDDALPLEAVAMHSMVCVQDLATGAEHGYFLVFPHEADLERGCISVLAPLGMALIGLKEGQEYGAVGPNGRIRRFRVKSVQQGAGADAVAQKAGAI
jgi:regulator of nucleoside diphosphate kinase